MNRKKIGLKHFNYLTDDFGIWQHTDGEEIDLEMGYALDDAARGLVLAAELGLSDQGKVFLQYLKRSAKYNCNFFSAKREPIPFSISDDAAGEVGWALQICVANDFFTEIAIKTYFDYATRFRKIKNLRGLAYLAIGQARLSHHQSAEILKISLDHRFSRSWQWPEASLNYGNAIIPMMLISLGEFFKYDNFSETGLLILNFLNQKTKYRGEPIAIGNQGWFPKNGKRSLFDQQPIDPAYQVLANILAYKKTEDPIFLAEARTYFDWFWGSNICKLPLINPILECCYDGLGKNRVSPNAGAESIICYLLAQHYLLQLDSA